MKAAHDVSGGLPLWWWEQLLFWKKLCWTKPIPMDKDSCVSGFRPSQIVDTAMLLIRRILTTLEALWFYVLMLHGSGWVGQNRSCYLHTRTHTHTLDATLWDLLLHLHTYGMLAYGWGGVGPRLTFPFTRASSILYMNHARHQVSYSSNTLYVQYLIHVLRYTSCICRACAALDI